MMGYWNWMVWKLSGMMKPHTAMNNDKQQRDFYDWILGRKDAPHPFSFMLELPQVPLPELYNPEEHDNRKDRRTV